MQIWENETIEILGTFVWKEARSEKEMNGETELVMKDSGAACMHTCRRMTAKMVRFLKINQKKMQ